MRGIGKIVGPVGLIFLLAGLLYMGYDAVKALVPLAIGGLLLAVGLFDAFRWDDRGR